MRSSKRRCRGYVENASRDASAGNVSHRVGSTQPARLVLGLSTIALLASACGSGSLTPDDAEDWPLPGTSSSGVQPTGMQSSTAPSVSTNPDLGSTGSSGSTNPGVAPTPATVPQPTTTAPAASACDSPQPGRSPLRRLTRFEYSNTVYALLGGASDVGKDLPAELLGNGFGNDADNQPSSAFLIEQYSTLARDLSVQIVTPDVAARYDACILDSATDEATCARSFISRFAQAAYRRPVTDGEVEELMALQQTLRSQGDFESSITAVVEAVLQSPDFLYRVEFGEGSTSDVRPLTGHEMANRLAYFFWGAPPDDRLSDAAVRGDLSTPTGIRAQAARLLEDPRARKVFEFFFDSYLPINNLTDQTRDKELFPSFSARIGALQREEAQQFLMHEIFDNAGSWDSVLTAPYTFVNEELAGFYGIAGVEGEQFTKVNVDTSKRLGLLTQGGILTGTTVTNTTNPVRRGGFLLSHVLCIDIPLPSEALAELIKPPEPYSGATGRERFSAHSQNDECASCHALLDPPGFALENYDAVGLWRDQENGVTIDASGNLPGVGDFSGPVELVQKIAANPNAHSCFAQQWQKFGYGRSLDAEDACNREQLDAAFEQSGHNIKELLLALTQTDGFRFLNAQEQL